MTEVYRSYLTLVYRDPAVEGKSFESTIEMSSLSQGIPKLPVEQVEEAIATIKAEVLSYKLENQCRFGHPEGPIASMLACMKTKGHDGNHVDAYGSTDHSWQPEAW